MRHLLIFSVLILPCVLLFILCYYEYRQKTNWRFIAQGVYDHIIYRCDKFNMNITMIYFQDGRTCVVGGILNNDDCVPGTLIRISRNGMGTSRIEIVKAA